MTYRGRVKNGVVVFEESLPLPEGTAVEVTALGSHVETQKNIDPTSLYERMKDLIGIFDDLPADFAENHDYYIHGCPKK
jgi:hypothetical protein